MKRAFIYIKPICLVIVFWFTPGCRSYLINQPSLDVYAAVHDRQLAALGETSNPSIGEETGELPLSSRMYSFNPRPVDPQLPQSFSEQPDDRAAGTEDQPALDLHDDVVTPPVDPGEALQAQSAENETRDTLTVSIFGEDEQDKVHVMGLRDALRYASQNARDLQDAKEDLYIAALDLTLERHLWTPQFVGSISAEFADFGQVRNFDRAMTAVSDIAVSQRLPYGGDVTARIVNTLMRDLGENTTSGETGSAILSANLPLLRGAGKVAYESRYSAERELIYGVRTFERFRRSFLVQVAARYFALQGVKSEIDNTYKSYKSRHLDWIKADFINRMGQSSNVFEAPRAKSSFRRAESALVNVKERYATSLDQFKIFLGMPVDALLDVVAQEVDEDAKALDKLRPSADPKESIDVALRYRLDFLNSADRLDDSYRGITITENAILPDLDANLSATMSSNPQRFNSASFNTKRTTYRGTFELRLDDRKRERNAYRQSIVTARRAERDHNLFADRVRADVRRAIRRLRQQEDLRDIQELQVKENELRAEAARANYDLGLTTNQDVVDAEDELLAARNDLALAVSAYRNDILELRRDTGTLRVGDDGQWRETDSTPNDSDDTTGP